MHFKLASIGNQWWLWKCNVLNLFIHTVIVGITSFLHLMNLNQSSLVEEWHGLLWIKVEHMVILKIDKTLMMFWLVSCIFLFLQFKYYRCSMMVLLRWSLISNYMCCLGNPWLKPSLCYSCLLIKIITCEKTLECLCLTLLLPMMIKVLGVFSIIGYFDKLIFFSNCTIKYIKKIIKVHHINFTKRKRDFLKGPTWLKCLHLTMGDGHFDKRLGVWNTWVTFDWNIWLKWHFWPCNKLIV
jgi:hypothetical protein